MHLQTNWRENGIHAFGERAVHSMSSSSSEGYWLESLMLLLSRIRTRLTRSTIENITSPSTIERRYVFTDAIRTFLTFAFQCKEETSKKVILIYFLGIFLGPKPYFWGRFWTGPRWMGWLENGRPEGNHAQILKKWYVVNVHACIYPQGMVHRPAYWRFANSFSQTPSSRKIIAPTETVQLQSLFFFWFWSEK